jgi:class 3 adenylate cyclase
MQTLNRRRAAAGDPVTSAYLALHIGEVFFGNIASEQRLDFTVVGPAVNEVSRIAAMCRSAERSVLVSSAFAAALPATDRDKLVSVGRYALREWAARKNCSRWTQPSCYRPPANMSNSRRGEWLGTAPSRIIEGSGAVQTSTVP